MSKSKTNILITTSDPTEVMTALESCRHIESLSVSVDFKSANAVNNKYTPKKITQSNTDRFLELLPPEIPCSDAQDIWLININGNKNSYRTALSCLIKRGVLEKRNGVFSKLKKDDPDPVARMLPHSGCNSRGAMQKAIVNVFNKSPNKSLNASSMFSVLGPEFAKSRGNVWQTMKNMSLSGELQKEEDGYFRLSSNKHKMNDHSSPEQQ